MANNALKLPDMPGIPKLRIKMNKIPLRTTQMFDTLKERAAQLGMNAAANGTAIRRK